MKVAIEKTDSLNWESRASFAIYRAAISRPPIKIMAKLVNFVVDDESISVGLWGTYILSILIVKWGNRTDLFCVPIALLSIIWHIYVWCLSESFLKLIIQRKRPPQYYFKQKDPGAPLPSLEVMGKLPLPANGVMLPGDQYSFPSGHTLRGFALARIFVKNSLVVHTFGSYLQQYEYSLFAVAIAIAWARVALGRHTLGDVIGGCILGVWYVDFLEPFLERAELLWLPVLLSVLYMLALYVMSISDAFFTSTNQPNETTTTTTTTTISWVRQTLGFRDSRHQMLFIFFFGMGYWVALSLLSISRGDFETCSR